MESSALLERKEEDGTSWLQDHASRRGRGNESKQRMNRKGWGGMRLRMFYCG